jgi:hypothetical protein
MVIARRPVGMDTTDRLMRYQEKGIAYCGTNAQSLAVADKTASV